LFFVGFTDVEGVLAVTCLFHVTLSACTVGEGDSFIIEVLGEE
jgi:hypothetical protein